jgi:hypothetical protein
MRALRFMNWKQDAEFVEVPKPKLKPMLWLWSEHGVVVTAHGVALVSKHIVKIPWLRMRPVAVEDWEQMEGWPITCWCRL